MGARVNFLLIDLSFFWVNERIGHCRSYLISGDRYGCRIGIDLAREKDHVNPYVLFSYVRNYVYCFS